MDEPCEKCRIEAMEREPWKGHVVAGRRTFQGRATKPFGRSVECGHRHRSKSAAQACIDTLVAALNATTTSTVTA